MDTKSPVLAIGDRSVMVSRTCPIRKAPWGADFSRDKKAAQPAMGSLLTGSQRKAAGSTRSGSGHDAGLCVEIQPQRQNAEVPQWRIHPRGWVQAIQ